MNQPQVGNEGRNDAAARAAAPQQKDGAAGGTAVLGPFSLRELVVFGALLVILIASLVPFGIRRGELFGVNIWNTGSVFFLGIGVLVPLAVGALFAARRLSPGTKLRVGSLSLDQFASVSAVLCLLYFLVQFSVLLSASLFICLLGALVFFAATTLAPHIPGFSADFAGRAEVPANRVARDAAPLARRPKAAPAATNQPGATGQPAGVGQPDPRTSGRPGMQAGVPAAGFPSAGRGASDGAAAAAGAGAAAAAGAGVGAAEAGQAVHGSGAQPPQQAAAPAQSGAAAQAGAAVPSTDTGITGSPAADRAGTGRDGSAPEAAGRPDAAGVSPTAAGHPEVSGGDVADGRPEGAATVQAGREETLPATTANPVVDSSAAHPRTESISAVRDENEPVVEAFWFAVGTPRQIVDERTGLPLFMFYPGDWELGLEDRGHEFLVQDKRTGRIGVLRDLSNIERVSGDDS